MEKILNNLTDEQYERTSEKFFEFNAFQKQQQIFHSNLSQNKDLFSLLSVHHEFRSPWVLKYPQKKARIDKIFSENIPETDHIEILTNKSITNFLNLFYSNREDSILTFMTSDFDNMHVLEFHSCNISSDVFIATFIIPALFGHFMGTNNVLSFIEAVGRGFDKCADHEIEFLPNFHKSFLSIVLRQFFFSPVLRSFYGEQFSCFLDLFAHVKHQVDSQYAKVQRFFNTFLSDLKESLKSPTSPLIHSLLIRISRKFRDKWSLLLTVLFYCIILPMVIDPISYGVLPLNYNLQETNEIAQKLINYYDLAYRNGQNNLDPDNLKSVFRPVNDDNYHPKKEEKSQTPRLKPNNKKPNPIGRSSSVYFVSSSKNTGFARRSISGPKLTSKEIHNIDHKMIDSFIDVALQVVPNQQNYPEIHSFVLPYRALQFLLENYDPDYSSQNFDNDKTTFQPFTIVKINLSIPQYLLLGLSDSSPIKSETDFTNEKSDELEMLITLFDLDDLESPKARVLKKHFELKSKNNPNFNFNLIFEEISQLTESLLSNIAEIQGMNHIIEKSIKRCKSSIIQANSIFVNQIVDTMMSEISFINDLKNKSSLMLKDSLVFSNFVISHLDLFEQKNKWASPLMRQIANKFHSKLTSQNFSLHDFISSAESQASSNDNKNYNDCSNLSQIDQKFLNNKMTVLSRLEQNGLDENVKKILSCKEIFDAAQTTILHSCLLEIPIESAKQIVLSLNTVEDIFLFVFGVRPEANQLMPLIANLFIISPVPMPLSFAQWLKHFLKILMEKRPEWFSDESMRPLEHYFTFGTWMNEFLLTIPD